MNLLLNLDQAAEQLGISKAQLRSLLRRGELPTIRLGRLLRVSPDHLEQYVKRKEREARSRQLANRQPRSA